MGGSSAPQPPPPPDPFKVAEAQGAANIDAAEAEQIMNNTNQETPYGSVKYLQSGGNFVPVLGGGQQYIPQFTAFTTLSPELKSLVDKNISNAQTAANTGGMLGQNVQSQLSNNVDLGPNATENYLNKLNTQTLDPQFQQAQTALNQQLTNQGLTPGSEGWKYAQTQFGLNKANTYNNMYLQGHNTAVQDILTQYNEPLNVLNALQSGSQVSQPGVGTIAPTSQQSIQPAPYANEVNTIYGDLTSQFNAQEQAHAQSQSGLMGLAGSGISALGGLFSDRKDKTDVEKLGDKDGFGIYAYRYKDDPKSYPKVVGPMAQDVEKKRPGSTFGIGGHRIIKAG